MEKQVLAASRIDESKTLVRQPFDDAFGHVYTSHNKFLNYRHPAYVYRLIDKQV
jgi:hypothetical protein